MLRITQVDTTGVAVTLRWTSAPNRFYTIERAKALGAGFSTLASNLPSSPPENVYQILLSAHAGASFYRIRVEPP